MAEGERQNEQSRGVTKAWGVGTERPQAEDAVCLRPARG